MFRVALTVSSVSVFTISPVPLFTVSSLPAATGPSSSSYGDDNEYRVLRGGGCDYAEFTVSDRTLKSPTDKAGRFGFRVVRTATVQ